MYAHSARRPGGERGNGADLGKLRGRYLALRAQRRTGHGNALHHGHHSHGVITDAQHFVDQFLMRVLRPDRFYTIIQLQPCPAHGIHRADARLRTCIRVGALPQTVDMVHTSKSRLFQGCSIGRTKIPHIGNKAHLRGQHCAHCPAVCQKFFLGEFRGRHQKQVFDPAGSQLTRQFHRLFQRFDAGWLAPARVCGKAAEFAVDATGLGVNTDLRKNNATATERCARIRIGRTQQCIIFRTAGGHLQQAQCVLPLQQRA